jgi:hypothetical protein
VNYGCGKCRHTHGEIFGAFWCWRAVAHPLATPNDDCLSGSYSVNALASFDLKFATQNNREFVEVRGLPRFAPTRWTDHAGDADSLGLRIGPTDELLDDFWRLTAGLDLGRRFNELWNMERE